MAINDQQLYTLINSPDFDPEQMGAAFWCEAYVVQKKKNEELESKLVNLEKELEQLQIQIEKMHTQKNTEKCIES